MCEWSTGPCCSMAKQLKGGYLLRYKKKLFGKAWKEEWVVLYENSHLVWYKDRDKPCPEGGLILSEAPELLAVGLWTLRIPERPDLPNGCHTRQAMAFGSRGKKVHWFVCRTEEEVNEWMTAISNTLPPPPSMPKDGTKSTPSHNKNLPNAELISSNCPYHQESGRRDQNFLANDYVTPITFGTAYYGYGWGWGPGWGSWASGPLGDNYTTLLSSGTSLLGTGISDIGEVDCSTHDYGTGAGLGFDDAAGSTAFDGFGGGDFGF